MTQKQKVAVQLQDRLGALIHQERELLNEILNLIIIADQNRMYLELGYPSLFEWLTRHFKYSESAAKRRIDSARMKKAVPALEEKIECGTVNLSTISKTQSAIRAEETRTKQRMTDEQKANLIEKIEGKSGLETEKILAAEFPEAQVFQREKVRVTSPSEMSVQILMSHEEYETFMRAKELLSHSVPNGSPGKVVAWLSQEFVRRKDPLRKEPSDGCVKTEVRSAADLDDRKSKNGATASKVTKSGSIVRTAANRNVPESSAQTASEKKMRGPFARTAGQSIAPKSSDDGLDDVPPKSGDSNAVRPKNPPGSRYIPSPVRHAVFLRDRGCCQAKDPLTGRICGSRHQIQIDHIQPWACGGAHALENLQCLCGQHNRHRSEATFGRRRVS